MSTALIDSAILRLERHAWGTQSTNASVLADYVWQLKRGAHPASPLSEIWSDILQDMAIINRELSKTPMAASDKLLPLSAVYAVNGILVCCLEIAVSEKIDHGQRRDITTLAWRVACAWDGVIAGDIEDLANHVKLQEWAMKGTNP